MNYLTFEALRQKLGGRSRSSIYRDVEYGRLPLPMKIGRINYWNEAEVDKAVLSLRSDLPTSGGTR